MNNLLSRSDTTQNALSKLRSDIVMYKYKNMQNLREVELSKKYNCSRPAIHSALLVLEREGLIQSHENGTKSVCCITEEYIKDLYDLREYIELTAVKQIISSRSNSLVMISNAVNEINNAVGNLQEQLDADTRFHTYIIMASNNKAILQAWTNISILLREIFSLNMTESRKYKDWFFKTFKQRHIELAEMLLSDNAKAAEAFKTHIREACETSLSAAVKRGADE